MDRGVPRGDLLPHNTASGCQLVYLFNCFQKSATFGMLSFQITLPIKGFNIPIYLPVHLPLEVLYKPCLLFQIRWSGNYCPQTCTCALVPIVTEMRLSIDPSRKSVPCTNYYLRRIKLVTWIPMKYA